MKLLFLLIISLPVFAQPYMGIGLQNKGINFSAGALVNRVELQAQYQMPLSSAIQPSILSFTGGLFIPISNQEQDNYSITIQAGAGFRKYKAYNEATNSISESIRDIKPVAGIEVGKDSHLGRVFIMAKHCDKLYYGVGLRCFFNR